MYIVTGGAGFIGSAMIWKLNSMGVDDILVVDNLGTSEKWKNLVNRRYRDYVHRDLFFEMMRRNAIEDKIEAVIHMGACSSTTERDADYLMRNNLSFSKAVCLFALEKKARFINASSGATYGDGSLGFDDDLEKMDELKPLNMYGYTKLLFDRWALREGCFKDIASLKFFNVYGPNEQHKGDMRSVANKAFHQIAKTGEMTLFRSCHPDYSDGGQMRDFVYIKDCCDIMWWLLQNGRVSGLFNVGTGKARSWNDLAAAVFSAMHLPADVRYVDMPEELAGKYQNFTEARMDRLKAAGYDAPMRSLEEGVADYVQNYLQTKDPYL